MKTMRQKAIDYVKSMSDSELDRLLVCGHDTNSHKWMEVYPDGTVNEAEEADNRTDHYISYPDKPVATIYNINDQCAEACNCDICTMYRRFRDCDKEEFIEDFGQDDWDYCNEHTQEEAILDFEHDSGNYGEDIRTQMLDAINEIELGYFNDEN